MTKKITIITFYLCLLLGARGVYAQESAPEPPSEFTLPSKYGAQMALGFQAGAAGKPLVVNLHSWSFDYTQDNLLAYAVAQAGWNYIQPDFQGPNNHPDACLSEKVITNIDEAIDWALENWKADRSAIYVVGFSGGGYVALGYYLKGKHELAGKSS